MSAYWTRVRNFNICLKLSLSASPFRPLHQTNLLKSPTVLNFLSRFEGGLYVKSTALR
jgi:hypothetical protein